LGEAPEARAVRAISRRARAAIAAAILLACVVAAAGALAATGDLGYIGCVGGVTGCTATSVALTAADGIVVSPDGANVYASSGEGGNAVDVFSRNSANGSLTFDGCNGSASGCTATNPSGAVDAPYGVVVSPNGANVYTADYGGNTVSAFARNASTGALTFVGCNGPLTGCTATSTSNALDGDYAVAVSPDGASVYVGGDNGISAFSRNTTTGALTFQACIGVGSCAATTPAGAVYDLESVAVSPDGKNVYAASAGNGVVDVFSRNTSNGTLTFASCIGDYSTCTAAPGPEVLASTAAVAVSDDGSTVYAAGTEYGDVSVLARNASTGALSFAGCVGEAADCTATTPAGALEEVYSLAASGDGDSVYTAGNGDTLAVLARNTATGALTFTHCFGALSGCTAATPATAFNGNRAVAVSPDGADVYSAAQVGVIDELARAVPPVLCSNASASTSFQTAVAVTLSCSDSEGLPLSYSAVSNPAHGTITAVSASGGLTYTPSAGYSGSDSFTFEASDREGVSSPATATITVATPPVDTASATVAGTQITLTTPNAALCLSAGGTLAATLSSRALAHVKGTKVSFVKAEIFIDGGVPHSKRQRKGNKVVKLTSYLPNATVRSLPASPTLALGRLSTATHRLTVKLFLRERRRGKPVRTIVKEITADFKVC
jgi:DNA-binding beta-propeller fold protein YncE